MTDRIPLDHLTSDQLDQLYAERDAARATNRRLNLRAQKLESELAAYRRAVDQWEVSEDRAYVPLRTLAAIAEAAGRAVPGVWELHWQRLRSAEEDARRALAQRQEMAAERYIWQERGDRAEAAIARVCDLADECEARGHSSGYPLTVTRIREALAEPAPEAAAPEANICPHGCNVAHCPCPACEAERLDEQGDTGRADAAEATLARIADYLNTSGPCCDRVARALTGIIGEHGEQPGTTANNPATSKDHP